MMKCATKRAAYKLLPATGLALISIIASGPITSSTAQAETAISAAPAGSAITVDGDSADWAGIKGSTVPLHGKSDVKSVLLKAAIKGDRIYFLAVWKDKNESRLHKPYKWDAASSSYKRTRQQEDRFAVMLDMGGDFTADVLSGKVFKADMWQWKSSRSDPANVAHDKYWTVDTKKFAKAKKFKGRAGNVVYIRRSSDKGDKLYKSAKYDTKQNDVMPRYKVNKKPKGSIADVTAKGAWSNGTWTLELSRKLNTGHADDAVIPAAGSIKFAVAAFNNTSDDKHASSATLVLNVGPTN